MFRHVLCGAVAVAMMAGQAVAQAPAVAADIAPVHALVARVMLGVAEPALIVRPGASPHEYAMRPSEAAALGGADLVFMVGPDLTPWLPGTAARMAPSARLVALLEAEGTGRLDYRENAVFDDHDHGHDHGGSDDHDGVDPHAWLDPGNARLWLDLIAGVLTESDPANEPVYRRNAEQGAAEIDRAAAAVDAALAPWRDRPFIVFHDAYQYFENRFGLTSAGAIAASDAASPGPARIAEIRRAAAGRGVVCVFAEPQFNPGLVEAVAEGLSARIAILDPLGSALSPGSALYVQLLEDLGARIADCLGGSA